MKPVFFLVAACWSAIASAQTADTLHKRSFFALEFSTDLNSTRINSKVYEDDPRLVVQPVYTASFMVTPAFYFSKWIGLGLGIGYSAFSNREQFTNFGNLPSMPGQPAVLRIDETRITRLEQTELMLALRFNIGNINRIHGYFHPGILAAYTSGAERSISGISTVSVLKPTGVVTEEGVSEKDEVITDMYSHVNGYWYLSAGLSIPLLKNLYANAGLNIRSSFTDLTSTGSRDMYRDVFGYRTYETTSAFASGIELGLKYHFRKSPGNMKTPVPRSLIFSAGYNATWIGYLSGEERPDFSREPGYATSFMLRTSLRFRSRTAFDIGIGYSAFSSRSKAEPSSGYTSRGSYLRTGGDFAYIDVVRSVELLLAPRFFVGDMHKLHAYISPGFIGSILVSADRNAEGILQSDETFPDGSRSSLALDMGWLSDDVSGNYNRVLLLGYLSAGICIPVSPHWMIEPGISGRYSLTPVARSENVRQYAGSTLASLGLEVGFRYLPGKP